MGVQGGERFGGGDWERVDLNLGVGVFVGVRLV